MATTINTYFDRVKLLQADTLTALETAINSLSQVITQVSNPASTLPALTLMLARIQLLHGLMFTMQLFALSEALLLTNDHCKSKAALRSQRLHRVRNSWILL